MKSLINFISESLESTIKIGKYDVDVITLGDKYGDYYFGTLAILNNPSDYRVSVGPPRLGKKSKLYETMSNMVNVYDKVICASDKSDDKQTNDFIKEIEPLLNSDKFEKTKCKDKTFKYDGNTITITGYVYSYKLKIDNDDDYNKLNVGILEVNESSYKDIYIYGNQNVIKDLLKK